MKRIEMQDIREYLKSTATALQIYRDPRREPDMSLLVMKRHDSLCATAQFGSTSFRFTSPEISAEWIYALVIALVDYQFVVEASDHEQVSRP
ncbi:MAG: hypothetical protein WC509_02075 [Candidatus Izemoplasmatales bacterium]